MNSFATRVAIFDEQQGAGDDRPFRVPVAGADPDVTICATDATGNWRALTPTDGADDMNAPSEQPTATVQDGRVFITGGRPDTDCPSDEIDDGVCAFQWVLFASPTDDVIDDSDPADRAWSLRAVRYCSTDPDCESTFAEWTDAQISRAARKVAPTSAMIFLGGWLLALGWVLLQDKPVPERVRQWAGRVLGSRWVTGNTD
jgi:hypothetical protein